MIDVKNKVRPTKILCKWKYCLYCTFVWVGGISLYFLAAYLERGSVTIREFVVIAFTSVLSLMIFVFVFWYANKKEKE